MKKISKVTVVMLVLAMVLSLCGCGGNATKKLYGTWSLNMDMGETISSEMGEEFADFESTLDVKLLFTFNEDGTFEMKVDKDSFVESFNGWLDDFIAYSVDMTYAQFADMGVEKADADAMIEEQFGGTMEDYLREMMEAQLDAEALAGEMSTDGIWEVKGDKLYMSEEDEIDEDDFDTFSISGDKLTINAPEGAESDTIIPGLEYPMVFTKEK